MIVVDTSTIIAIVRHEAEEQVLTEILDNSSATLMSAVSYVEAYMVIFGRRSGVLSDPLESLVASLGIEIAEVTGEQARMAVHAFLAYGKGRHAARLNLAGCFAYALAKTRNAPLLFKGGDFSKTDVVPAWQP